MEAEAARDGRRCDEHEHHASQSRRALRLGSGAVGGVLHRSLRIRGDRPGAAGQRRVSSPPDSDNHHDLGLFGLGPAAVPKQRGAVGLYHLAWQVDTIDDLVAARQALLEVGALGGESSHGATKSLYGVDPDGNEFEIMWLLPRDSWGEHESQAIVERLDLAGEVERWSGVKTG